MNNLSLLLLATLSILVSAKVCTETDVSISINARQGVFNIAIPHTNIQAVDFALNITQQGRNFTDVALTGYQTISKTYSISARYCKPLGCKLKGPSIQVLTHGIGFDKTYWDLPYKSNHSYSYIDLAVDTYKYHTLSYDRLGLGASSHGDPLNEIQAPLEVQVIQALSYLLRTGTYPGVSKAFSKIIHVGHSFGSILSYSFADAYPELSDAMVLTGFALDTAYVGLYSAGNNFILANQDKENKRLHNLPDGYLVASDEGAIKYLHLKPGFFDDGILKLAAKTKEPVTLGEMLTVLSIPGTNQFTKPVIVMDGDSDLVFCGSNCSSTVGYDPNYASIPAKVKDAFPGVAASNFTAYVQPNTGHGINFHYNATGANTVINEFLNARGLLPT